MTPAELTDHWRTCYCVEPIAHDLRNAVPDRWLRIHGLPEMKRYPESPDEYTVVFHRHNEVLSSLLRPGTEAILITTGWSDTRNPTPVQDEGLKDTAAWHWKTVPLDPDDPESSLWHLFARTIFWQPGILDVVLLRVADWKSVNVIVLSILQCAAYLPYDGGGDIIARDKRQRDELKVRFRNWLSPLPSGL